MGEKQLYDISDVCNMLGTTSRTLRFYEEKGVITSTTIDISSRRKYTEDQLSHIKNVLVLRTLGLSIKSIAELQNQECDLKDAVLAKRAEIYASIDNRIREIDLLNEALSALESDKNIFEQNWQHTPDMTHDESETVKLCTDAILTGNDEVLYNYLSPRMAEYMPKNVYHTVRKDTLAPLGDFVSIEKTVVDAKFPNKIYRYVRFSKLGLKITFVFYSEKIDGLWLNYYDAYAR